MKVFLNTKIGRHLLAVLVIVSVLPLLAMGILAIRRSESAVEEQTRSVLRSASDGAEAQLREFLLHLKQELLALTVDKRITEALPGLPAPDNAQGAPTRAVSKLCDLLAREQSRVPESLETFILSPQGRVVASSDPEKIGDDLSSADYFLRGKNSFFPGDVFREPENGRLGWVMSAPIQESASHRVLGVIALRMDPGSLSALVTGRRLLAQGAATQSFRIGQSGETYIVNRDHYMITESRYVPNSVLRIKVDTLPVRLAFERGEQISADYPDYRGVRVSGTSMVLLDMGWVVLSEIDFSQAFTPIRRLRNQLLGFIATLCLLALVLAWTWTRGIIRPLQTISNSDLALAGGDEKAALVPETGLPSNEIGEFVRKRNIRVRELLEQRHELLQEQKLRAEATAELDQISYSIMHDMRAPLRAINGFADLIEQGALDRLSPEQRAYLARMRSAAKRMDQLICDVLNYSLLVRGELPLHPVDASELLLGILETYPAFQALKNQVQVPPGLPLVQGNEAALTQCFSCLLDNAVKFAKPDQSPKITIRGERIKDRLRIWIEDEGIGIPKELQERIFGIFQKGSKGGESTGIGLALVRKSVARMGGRVGVTSEPGLGSKFWIELGIAEEAARGAAARES